MKIDVFTLCWNEMDVLPWVVDYWERYASHVTVYDNGSTDGSAWFLSKYDWITVIPFSSGGFNDTVNQRIKNECWKDSDADYVVVCDMDECLFAKDIKTTLRKMKEEGATICEPQWYELMSDVFPEYKKGMLMHEAYPLCRHVQNGAKAVIFDPKAIMSMNYTPGAHSCNPIGNIKLYEGKDLFTLHFNHNLSLQYKLSRYRELQGRLSEENKKKGHGIHYAFSEVILTKAWEEDMKNVVNLNDIVNGKSSGDGFVPSR